MHQHVFIFGATGHVGSELIRQIATLDVQELGIHVNPTVVVGLADSHNAVITRGGFSQNALLKLAANHDLKGLAEGEHVQSNGDPKTLLKFMQKAGFESDLVFVDATAAMEVMRDFHLEVMTKTTCRIVTANKNPISRYDYETYYCLTEDPTRYAYSATTMAGLGAVPWISERVTLQDPVTHITASLSGTLGFLTEKLSQGKRLSGALREAKENGYTEPDFRDDLNGVDVARKLVILAREAGYRVHFEDVKISKFLPEQFFAFETEAACLEAIEKDYDAVMKEKIDRARKAGETWKFLATLSVSGANPTLEVGLQEVSMNSAFGRLRGTSNRIEVITSIYDQGKPYILEGPGAGLPITASVLRRDLLRMQQRVNRISAS